MSRYLILGAGGFIGKAVTLKLSEENTVVAFDRQVVSDFEGNSNIVSVLGNFTEADNFDTLLKGVDCVIHLISTTVPNDDTSHIPQEIMANVVPTVRLLESMKNQGVKKIVFSSSAGAYYGETGDKVNTADTPANPYCSYGVQKAVIEEYVKFYGVRYGMDYRIMRISNPYGWGQDPSKMQGLIPIFINRLLNGKPISVFGDGENKRDYIFMTDLINAIIKVCAYNGSERIFNIGYGKYYSINEIVDMIESISGKNFVQINYSEERFCDVKHSFVDMKQAQDILGWRPETNIADGIKVVYEVIRKLTEQ